MEKILMKFTCTNKSCKVQDNFVELTEVDATRAKWLLYCGNCGQVYMTKQQVLVDQGKKWLPCIDYKGSASNLTRGPVPDSKGGIAWGVAGGVENISEEEFMERYAINPRIDWCKRSKRSDHPSYDQICSVREVIKPVEYKVPPPPVGPHDVKPNVPAHTH